MGWRLWLAALAGGFGWRLWLVALAGAFGGSDTAAAPRRRRSSLRPVRDRYCTTLLHVPAIRRKRSFPHPLHSSFIP